MLYQTNPTLYNTCLRQGLKKPMEILSGCENEEGRVKTLYRCRVNGLSVLVFKGDILVNGVAFSPAELDDPKAVLKRANG